MRSYYVYIIECLVNSKLYVGISYNPSKRWQRHISTARARKYKTPLYNAINKYGEGRFRFSTIQHCVSLDEANCSEKDWIAYLKRMGLKLFNLTEGGDGTAGVTWTRERKQKASDRNSGDKNYFYGKKLIGAANGHFGKKIKPHVQQELLKHRTKLSDAQVEELKAKHATGNFTQTALAKEFEISLTQVHRIIHGRRRLGSNNAKALLTKPNITKEVVDQIRQLASEGIPQKDLARRFGLSTTQIGRIVRRERWKS